MAVGTSLISSGAVASSTAATRAAGARTTKGPYNFLFILTGQERYFRQGESPRTTHCRHTSVWQNGGSCSRTTRSIPACALPRARCFTTAVGS